MTIWNFFDFFIDYMHDQARVNGATKLESNWMDL